MAGPLSTNENRGDLGTRVPNPRPLETVSSGSTSLSSQSASPVSLNLNGVHLDRRANVAAAASTPSAGDHNNTTQAQKRTPTGPSEIVTRVKSIKDILKDLLSLPSEAPGREAREKRVSDALSTIDYVVENYLPHPPREYKDTLPDIAKGITDIRRILKSGIPQKTQKPIAPTVPSWANIAATARPLTTQALNSRQQREIIVKIPKEDDNNFKNNTPAEIVTAIQSQAGPDVLAARKLPSGDIQLHTTSSAARERLVKNDAWITVLAKEARITRRTYPVMVHAVGLDQIDVQDQAKSISKIISQNSGYHQGLRIERIAWSRSVAIAKAKGTGKTHAGLRVELPTQEAADKIIENGLLFDSELKNATLYVWDSKPTLCFKCNRFGHITHACRNETKCGHCGNPHNTKDCSHQGTPPRCPNCNGPHNAWEHVCPAFRKAKAKADHAWITRPERYQPYAGSRQQNFAFSATTAPMSAYMNAKKRKADGEPNRGPGRPVRQETGLQKIGSFINLGSEFFPQEQPVQQPVQQEGEMSGLDEL